TVESASTVMATHGVPLLLVTRQNQPIGILAARNIVCSPARSGSRIAVSLKVHDAKPPLTTQVAAISQLSHLGAFVETPTPFPPGTNMSLNFYLPGSGRQIQAHATVLKSRGRMKAPRGALETQPAGMEVEFTRLAGSDQSQITAWVIRSLYK
ncbi:MAG: PilZ domain-containing protein, partial [Candidatus Methylomirabilaceae bacterium]